NSAFIKVILLWVKGSAIGMIILGSRSMQAIENMVAVHYELQRIIFGHGYRIPLSVQMSKKSAIRATCNPTLSSSPSLLFREVIDTNRS
ncbi:uncharacterized protein LOC117209486, partial [Bombus bifarius]|uniref:Uncharacterized protein LOC117209486 n=1 Tax=Bombus bifarius TaxID=103933 RepID=A0A6P8MXJ2_9HYME